MNTAYVVIRENTCFFDGTHYSEATNKQLVEMMWDKKSGFIFPYGVKDFFEISNSTSLKSAT